MKKLLSWLLWIPLFICLGIAYLISGEPEEKITVKNYSRLLSGEIKKNFLVFYDDNDPTLIFKHGGGENGSYTILSRNDTRIIVFEKYGSGKISNPCLLKFVGTENHHLFDEITIAKNVLKDSHGFFVFEPIFSQDELVNKHENLIGLLIFIPMALYLIGIKLYGFFLWAKDNL